MGKSKKRVAIGCALALALVVVMGCCLATCERPQAPEGQMADLAADAGEVAPAGDPVPADGGEVDSADEAAESDAPAAPSLAAPASGNAPEPRAQGKPSQPAHQHSWAPQYATVHHDAVTEQVWVPDYVRVGIYECRACGFTTTDHGVIQEHCTAIYGAHPETGSNYGSNYQMVESGGHHETNAISAAWDEQVVTGYACSCGATK